MECECHSKQCLFSASFSIVDAIIQFFASSAYIGACTTCQIVFDKVQHDEQISSVWMNDNILSIDSP